MKTLVLLSLLANAGPSLGQAATSGIQREVLQGPKFEEPLVANLLIMPQRLSADDSLAREAYHRNRVRSVALLQLRDGGRADTTDYTELDRQGNVTFIRPAFGQRIQQQFNRQQVLVAHTSYPAFADDPLWRSTYDPATHVTTTYIGPSLAALATMQVARRTQRGDTLQTEAFLYPVPGLPAQPIARLVLQLYRVGPDTTRTDVVAYDAAQHVIGSESYYTRGPRQLPTETGVITWEVSPVGPRSAALLYAASRRTHGRYQPTSRNTYAANGLVRTLYLPRASDQARQPTTASSADGRASLTISTPRDTSSVRYVRAPQGYLLREEYRLPGAAPSGAPTTPQLSFTEYTYWPTGLRRTKAGSLTARYEYRYTYY